MGTITTYIKGQQTRAAGILFIVNALVFGNWAVRIPTIKQQLGLADDTLGMALLYSPLGVIVVSGLSAWGIKRFGAGKVAMVSGIMMCAVMAMMGLIGSYFQLTLILFIYGLSHGSLDIATNAYVTIVEKEQDRSIMSISHGFWSMGAMVGSVLGSLLLRTNITFAYHMILVGMLCTLLLFSIYNTIWGIEDVDEKAFKWRYPGNWALFLAVFVFIIFVVEGAIADWAALFYKEILHSPEHLIGLGFGAFSGAMALARFKGDDIMMRFDQKKILWIGSSVVGLCLIAFSQSRLVWQASCIMLVCGSFCSVLVPIVFKEAARIKGVSASLGLAFVSSIGYIGFLIGPPLLGFVSASTSLSISFASLGVLVLLLAVSLKVFRR